MAAVRSIPAPSETAAASLPRPVSRAMDAPEQPRVAVVQLGARRHYAIPAMLERGGMLDRFYTDLTAHTWWLRAARRVVPASAAPAALRRLLARQVAAVPHEKVSHLTAFGVSRIVRRDRNTLRGQLLQAQLQANRQFCRLVAQRGLGNANVLYVFNGAGLELLQEARRRGMLCVLEQTSAPVAFEERLLAEERQRWPDWEIGGAIDPGAWQESAARERGEWDLADVILCGSQYVVDTIRAESGPADKCVVVPYGVSAELSFAAPRPVHDRPLRVLAVGQIVLPKGFQYLIDLAARMQTQLRDDCAPEFRIVGPLHVSPAAQKQLAQRLQLVGAVPRDQIRAQYEWADVFVLPSLSEGSANVCYEALATGLPVITTPHAGSVVRDGMEGFIVPIRSSDAIACALEKLNLNRPLLSRMSLAALQRASEFTWDRYADRLLAQLRRAFESRRAETHKIGTWS